MNFIEAVRRLNNDCYSEMYKEDDFNNRLRLVDDELHYVESAMHYIPTSKDMLVEDWIVTCEEIVNGIRINDLKDKTIKHIKYIDYHFVFTLCNGKKYKFLGDSYGEGSSAVGITEITGM